MNRITILKSLAAAALALGTLAAATSAQARNDVDFSVTAGTPGAHARHAPAYVQHRPAYVQHRHVYVQPRHMYGQPAPAYRYRHPAYAQPAPRHGWGHRHHYNHGHNMNARGPRSDLDRDGIPNRHDRFPRNSNWR